MSPVTLDRQGQWAQGPELPIANSPSFARTRKYLVSTHWLLYKSCCSLRPKAIKLSQSFHGNRNVWFVCIFSYYKYYVRLHYLCISVLILEMWKLRRREIKQLSQGKWWVKYMIGLTFITLWIGGGVCLALAHGMWRKACVTLGGMSPWSRMCFAFLPWWHILDIEKLPPWVCKWGSRGVAMPTALPWM